MNEVFYGTWLTRDSNKRTREGLSVYDDSRSLFLPKWMAMKMLDKKLNLPYQCQLALISIIIISSHN